MTLGMLTHVFAMCVCWLAGCRLWFWPDVLVIHQASLVHHIVGSQGSQEQQKGMAYCASACLVSICVMFATVPLAKESPGLV